MRTKNESGSSAVTLLLWLATTAAFTTAIVLAAYRTPEDKFAANPHRWYAIALIIVGVVLAIALRRIARANATQTSPSAGASGGTVDLAASRIALVEGSRRVHSELDAKDIEANKDAITELLQAHVEIIVDQRSTLSERFGLGPFTAFLSDVSRGERNLNRAWSALTDQHVEEARTALASAAEAFEEAVVPTGA